MKTKTDNGKSIAEQIEQETRAEVLAEMQQEMQAKKDPLSYQTADEQTKQLAWDLGILSLQREEARARLQQAEQAYAEVAQKMIDRSKTN